MASSWGPKVIGPDAIKTHAGKDLGQTYLQHARRRHRARTSSRRFERGRQYTLTRNDDYWGPKPYFKTVLIKITPDIGTPAAASCRTATSTRSCTPSRRPSSRRCPTASIVLKKDSSTCACCSTSTRTRRRSTTRPCARGAALDDRRRPARRAGLRGHGDASDRRRTRRRSCPASRRCRTRSTTPPPRRPPARRSTKQITLAYTADESGVQRRVGELLQAQLKTAGYDVTLRRCSCPTRYGYVKHLKTAPDLMLQTNTPDAAHPDTVGADRLLLDRRAELLRLQRQDRSTPSSTRRSTRPTAEGDEALPGGRPARHRLATRCSSSATSRTSSSCSKDLDGRAERAGVPVDRDVRAAEAGGDADGGGADRHGGSSRSSRSCCGLAVIVFVLQAVIPSDPARAMVGASASPRGRRGQGARARLRQAAARALRRLHRAARLSGDLQNSLRTRNPVAEDLGDVRAGDARARAVAASVLAALMGVGARRWRSPAAGGRRARCASTLVAGASVPGVPRRAAGDPRLLLGARTCCRRRAG